jgi:hypothetical protein
MIGDSHLLCPKCLHELGYQTLKEFATKDAALAVLRRLVRKTAEKRKFFANDYILSKCENNKEFT